MSDFLRNPAKYRKFVIAGVGAVVTGLVTFGVPVADEVPDAVVGIFDAVVAALVLIVPNDD